SRSFLFGSRCYAPDLRGIFTFAARRFVRANILGATPVKKIAIVPTLLTLGNGVCGFAAIACASKIGSVADWASGHDPYFALSGWLILAAMVFDALAGYVARLSRTASNFCAEPV